MNTSVRFGAAFLLSSLLSAQANQTPGAVAPQGPATKPTNPEAAVKVATPEERVAQLRKELEKLQGEKAFIDQVEQKGGIAARVRSTVTDRKVTAQTTDDSGFRASSQPSGGAGAVAKSDTVAGEQQAPPTRKKARLLGDGEKAKLGAEAVMTVDGLVVTKAEVEEVANYFKSYMTDTADDALKSRAIMQLVGARAAEAAFPETAGAALRRISEAQKALAGGKAFEDVAKEMSQCPSKERGGDLGNFRREGMMDLLFAKAAFSQKVGDVSPVIRTPFGYHIVKTTAFKKGGATAQDEVQASHILAMYDPDQMKVRQAMGRVYGGQVDVAFVNDEWRKLCPSELK